MENFNLALLAAPVSVRRVATDIKAVPAKSSEKEFSGILTKAEDRYDGGEDSTVVNQNESKKPSVDRKANRTKYAESSTKSRPLKKKSPDKTTENTDDDLETGANVLAVPVEEVAKDDSSKNRRLTGFADNLEIQTLFSEMSEEVVLPSVQTDVQASALMDSEVGVLDGAVEVSKNLFPEIGNGNAGNEEPQLSGWFVGDDASGSAQLLPQESAKSELGAKLFSANVKVDPETETAAEKATVQLQSDERNPTKLFSTEATVATETVAEKVIGKLQPADRAAKLSVENVAEASDEIKVEKVAVKLQPADKKNEPAAVGAEKVKIEIIKNSKVENAKIEMAAQNSASDISTAMAAADSVSAEDVIEGPRRSGMVENQPAQGGVSLSEIPDEVEVSVKSEAVVSDEKLQQRTNFSKRSSGNRLFSGSQTGTVHLQGQARENQPSLMQDNSGQNQSGQSEFKLNQATFAEGENRRNQSAGFAEEMKATASEKVVSEAALANETENKLLSETNFSKTSPLPEMKSHFSEAAALNKGAHSSLSKPLPISDDHLLSQIQAGLTKPVNGRQTVTIKLWPEHLGQVDVKLVMHKQHLTATFMVDHTEIKDAMLRKIDSLRDSLGLHGIEAKDIAVKVSPVKSGDGMSLLTDNQSNQNNNAWRQFDPNGFAQGGNSQSQSGWAEDGSDGQVLTGSEISEEMVAYADSGIDPGSLHITA